MTSVRLIKFNEKCDIRFVRLVRFVRFVTLVRFVRLVIFWIWCNWLSGLDMYLYISRIDNWVALLLLLLFYFIVQATIRARWQWQKTDRPTDRALDVCWAQSGVDWNDTQLFHCLVQKSSLGWLTIGLILLHLHCETFVKLSWLYYEILSLLLLNYLKNGEQEKEELKEQ